MRNGYLQPARCLLIAALAALWAAGWPQVGQAHPQQTPPTAAPAKPAVKTSVPAAKAKAPAKTVPVPAAVKKAAVPTPAKQASSAPPVPTPKQVPVYAGRRDPFKLPPPPGPRGEPQVSSEDLPKGPPPSGTHGLVVSQLRLGGIVRQDLTNTMIAVVTNYTNRAYFLRENDTVYNGVVSKITPDAVYFRENYLDQNGRPQTREAVKRLSPPTGEER